MAPAVAAEPVPLSVGRDQVMLIAGTRVALETVILSFDAGATPEEIAQDFPALALTDIYAVITYYLRHRKEVGVYLERRRASAEGMRRKVETRFNPSGFRERLQARLDPSG